MAAEPRKVLITAHGHGASEHGTVVVQRLIASGKRELFTGVWAILVRAVDVSRHRGLLTVKDGEDKGVLRVKGHTDTLVSNFRISCENWLVVLGKGFEHVAGGHHRLARVHRHLLNID